jgi:membrane protease YdiL (CAAX protease family)
LLFAFVHLRFVNIGALFVWGLLFCFVYYKTNSIECSILLHSIINGFGFFIKHDFIEITGMHFFKFIITMVICLIIIYLIISYINRNYRIKKDASTDCAAVL